MGAEGEEPGFRQLAYLGDQQAQTPKGHHIPAAGVGTALGTPLTLCSFVCLTRMDVDGTRQGGSDAADCSVSCVLPHPRHVVNSYRVPSPCKLCGTPWYEV